MSAMAGTCSNVGKCVLAAAGTVQEIASGPFACRECKLPLTREAPPAQAASAAGTVRPPTARAAAATQVAPALAKPPMPPPPPPKADASRPAAAKNGAGTIPRAAAAGTPATNGTAAAVQAARAAPAPQPSARPAAAPRPANGAAARPGAVDAARRAGSPAAAAGLDPAASEARYQARFPAGVVIGGAAFALMAAFAYWVVHDWRLDAPAAQGRGPQAVAALSAPARAAPAGGQVALRVAGSDAMAAQLGPALAEALLASLGASDVKVSTPAAGEVEVRGTKDGHPQVVTVSRRDSPFDALLAGSADVVLVSRPVLPEEERKLSALGSMTSEANEHVLGIDAVAVIVSRANPLSELKRDQLAQILTGKASDWSSLGGAPGAIHLYVPDDGGATAATLRSRVLGPARLTERAKRLATDQAVVDAVVADVGAVGLVALPWARAAKTLAVADAGTEAVIPNAFTLAGEEYVLSRRLYLYTAAAPQNPLVSRFVELALGREGQLVVKKSGFVEMTLHAEPRSAPAGAPPSYVQLTSGARRLTTAFRFRAASTELDSRASRDLDRVVEFLRDNDLNGASVRLLGFDATSARGASPRGRAVVVAKALAQRGVGGATVEEFGAAIPVADDGSEEGRQRNRRVEIWIAR